MPRAASGEVRESSFWLGSSVQAKLSNERKNSGQSWPQGPSWVDGHSPERGVLGSLTVPAAPAFQLLSLLPRLLSHVTQWSCGRYSQPPAAHLSSEDQPLTPAWALLVHWPGVLLQQPECLEAAEAPAHLSLSTLWVRLSPSPSGLLRWAQVRGQLQEVGGG